MQHFTSAPQPKNIPLRPLWQVLKTHDSSCFSAPKSATSASFQAPRTQDLLSIFRPQTSSPSLLSDPFAVPMRDAAGRGERSHPTALHPQGHTCTFGERLDTAEGPAPHLCGAAPAQAGHRFITAASGSLSPALVGGAGPAPQTPAAPSTPAGSRAQPPPGTPARRSRGPSPPLRPPAPARRRRSPPGRRCPTCAGSGRGCPAPQAEPESQMGLPLLPPARTRVRPQNPPTNPRRALGPGLLFPPPVPREQSLHPPLFHTGMGSRTEDWKEKRKTREKTEVPPENERPKEKVRDVEEIKHNRDEKPCREMEQEKAGSASRTEG